jgi:hypothetical protein
MSILKSKYLQMVKAQTDGNMCTALLENIWNAAREYARDNKLEYNYAVVQGIAPL